MSEQVDEVQQCATTKCFAWHLICQDQTRLGFTDHDASIVVDGVECAPNTGFTPSVAEAALGLSGDISQVEGALSSDEITLHDIEIGKYDNARITQYILDWRDPSDAELIRNYHVGEITVSDDAILVELRSYSTNLDRVNGRYYRRNCDADLGDTRCGVDLNGPQWRVAGHVADTSNADLQHLYLNIADVFDIATFYNGHILFNSGSLAGTKALIASIAHDPSAMKATITLVEPLILEPNPDDTVTLIAGCDKQFSTCRNRFENHLNFRGFPHIPSNDKALNYADSEAVMDGSPLVL